MFEVLGIRRTRDGGLKRHSRDSFVFEVLEIRRIWSGHLKRGFGVLNRRGIQRGIRRGIRGRYLMVSCCV